MSAVVATSRLGGLPVRRRRSATVIPDVTSPRVAVSEGAVLEGKVTMTLEPPATRKNA